jgi:hypothetical protein
MDPDPAPDPEPAPDPTPDQRLLSSLILRMQENFFFFPYFFHITFPQAQKFKFLLNFVLKFYFAVLSSHEKKEGCGKPKNMRILIPNTGKKPLYLKSKNRLVYYVEVKY